MSFFKNLFKKDEDEREAAYQPSSDDTKAVEAKGSGKASGKNIEKPDGGFTDTQQQRITRSRTDSNWGYYDPNTGNYVPWYIDIQDGGGRNQSGDTFEGAGLYSMALNAAGVAPYGYNRPRTYARAGMVGRPDLPQPSIPTPPSPQLSTPTPSSTPAPSGNMAINAPNPAGLSFGAPMQNTMTYRPADVPNQLGYPSAQPTNFQFNTSEGMQQRLATMPLAVAPQVAEAYKNYLMTGGTSTFDEFMQGMY